MAFDHPITFIMSFSAALQETDSTPSEVLSLSTLPVMCIVIEAFSRNVSESVGGGAAEEAND